jgi:DNA-binding response OmpR family regulator
MQRPRIALVDDETDLAEPLADYLSDRGYEVYVAGSGAECIHILERHAIDLTVLDLGLPDGGGLDLLRRLRDTYSTAVLVLTGNPDLVERIAGLEIGADDFVVKPVEPQELAARIDGILHRRGAGGHEIVRLERSTVDLTASRLLRHGRDPERLGAGEVTLIQAFVRHPNRILTRDELMDMAPAESLEANDRSIDTRLARLRRKLDTDAITTVRGHGYMFVPPFEKAN